MPQNAGRSACHATFCSLRLGVHLKGQAPISVEVAVPDQHGRHALDTGPRAILHGTTLHVFNVRAKNISPVARTSTARHNPRLLTPSSLLLLNLLMIIISV
ncbi:hypothetical protein BDR04DRAFT_1110731 [Suillus decipiens]|nr:hypothetical protein BDR04DRAFT_1110731 [Suillus decipiens]